MAVHDEDSILYTHAHESPELKTVRSFWVPAGGVEAEARRPWMMMMMMLLLLMDDDDDDTWDWPSFAVLGIA